MAQEARNDIPPTVQCSLVANGLDSQLNFLTIGPFGDQDPDRCFISSADMFALAAALQKSPAQGAGTDSAKDHAKDPVKGHATDKTLDQVSPATKAAADSPKDHLTKLADDLVAANALKPKDRDRLKSDMADFETRSAQAGLTASEISQTYTNLSNLIEFSGQSALDQPSRIKIAEQALHHAAYPTQIDQGRHDTCNVTTVEVRTFSRNPAAATKLIAEVATTGGATAADGTKIVIDAKSLKADDESNHNPTADRDRSYASQLFQIAAVNIFWQRRDTDPAGNYATKGSLRFEQDPKKRGYFGNDTGERLMAYWSNPPKELAKGPALGASDLKDITDQITGGTADGFVIENQIKGGPNTMHVGSEQDLKDVLVKMKKSGDFPAIIRVHTGNEPFLTDQGGGLSRSKGVWHVVSITAYDEQSGKVWIDNQWGKSSDHVMKLSDVYKATLEPKGGAWQMMHESTMPSLHWHRSSTLLPENELWLH